MRRLTALLILAAAPALGAERLSSEGVRLPDASYAADAPFEIRVAAPAGDVLAAHAAMRPHGTNLHLTRDRDGYWATWSGRMDDLIPTAAKREGGELVFKIFDRPPDALSPPFKLLIGYRTPQGLEYGWLFATPAVPTAGDGE